MGKWGITVIITNKTANTKNIVCLVKAEVIGVGEIFVN
jgi:hypothetical protein